MFLLEPPSVLLRSKETTEVVDSINSHRREKLAGLTPLFAIPRWITDGCTLKIFKTRLMPSGESLQLERLRLDICPLETRSSLIVARACIERVISERLSLLLIHFFLI